MKKNLLKCSCQFVLLLFMGVSPSGLQAQDITPPNHVDNVRMLSRTSSSISIAWDPATDNVGVERYRVHLDGDGVAWEEGTSYTLSNLQPGTSYSISVIAYDAADNWQDLGIEELERTLVARTEGAPSEQMRSYFFGHSLVKYDLNESSIMTTVPFWIHSLASSAGRNYYADGRFGQLDVQIRNLPAKKQFSFDSLPPNRNFTPPSAFHLSLEESNFENISITASNWIQDIAPDQDANPSTLDYALQLLDSIWAKSPSSDLYIYEHWPERAELTTSEFHLRATGVFHDWFLEFQDMIMAARPQYNIKLVPVGGPVSSMLTELPQFSGLTLDDLFSDEASHGHPVYYFFSGLIHYMTYYQEKPNAQYVVPTTHPTDIPQVVKDNYNIIVNYLWDELQAVNYNDGTSRVWNGPADNTPYSLTVNAGTGSGNYVRGTAVSIEANPPESGLVFSRWEGDVQGIADINAPITTLIMPASNSAVTATYSSDSLYSLVVNNGSGSGLYTEGTLVSINANAPSEGFAFSGWTGDIGGITDISASQTTFLVGTSSAIISAEYESAGVDNIPPTSPSILQVIDSTSTTVTFTWSNDATDNVGISHYLLYNENDDTSETTSDTTITISNLLPNTEYSFTLVTFDQSNNFAIDGPSVAFSTRSENDGIDSIYTLTVMNGSGSGQYPTGQSIDILADSAAEGFVFSEWTGDTEGIADITVSQTIFLVGTSDATISASYEPVGIDSVLPTSPSTFVVIDSTATSVTLAWSNDATDNVGISHYLLHNENDDTSEITSDTTITISNLLPSTEYNFALVTFDLSNNFATDGPSVSFSTLSENDVVDTLYTLTVVNGSGSGQYAAGEIITLVADQASAGYSFLMWVGCDGVADASATETTYTMTATNSTIAATYAPANHEYFTLTVTNGSGSGDYEAGEVIDITADDAPVGQVFSSWTGDITHLSSINSTSTQVTMPNNAVALTANYTTIAPPPSDSTSTHNMGINTSPLVDWSNDKPFADMMRTARLWQARRIDGVGGLAPLDPDGWPTTDFSIIIYHREDDLYEDYQFEDMHGRYRARFEGSADVNFLIGDGDGIIPYQIENLNYDSQLDITTFDLVIPLNDISLIMAEFRNTGDGIKNIQMMRPSTIGGNDPYPFDKVWNDQYLNLLEPYSTIRYMGWTNTNGSRDSLWENTIPWSYSSFYTEDVSPASWESIIKLSNRLQKDAWICVPHKVNDDYIQNLALLFRDGSASCEPLDPNLNLYIEYSNEIWNWAGDFPQTGWVFNQSLTYGHPITFDGLVPEDERTTAMYRYKAMRSVRISEIFREVFGDNQMMNRIRPVICWQKDWNDLLSRTLSFVDLYYNARDSRSDRTEPHPVNYYFYGGGGSAYWNNHTTDLTVDNIWDAGEWNPNTFADNLYKDAAWAASLGMTYIAYEGDNHHDISVPGEEEIYRQVHWDERMYQETVEHLDAYSWLGGDLFCFLALSNIGEVVWGAYNMLDGLPRSPQYRAVLDLEGTNSPSVRYGSTIPFSISGRAFDVFSIDNPQPKSAEGSLHLLSNTSAHASAYCFRADVVTQAQFQISYHTTDVGTLAIEYDGTEIQRIELPNTNSEVATTGQISLSVDPDKLHALRLVAVDGEVHIDQIDMVEVNTVNQGAKQVIAGINDPLQNLKVYPIPSDGLLHVEVKGNFNRSKLIITGIDGRAISQRHVTKGLETIDLRSVPKGLYVVSLVNADTRVSKLITIR